MLEPLYTADEMRAAEAGHDVDAMMERAGRAVAEAVLERYPSARRIACVCGGGANGGGRRVPAHVPRRREGDNKYTAGAVLVVGGAPGLTGAVCLAAEAAFRADAGYVAVAVPEASLPVLELRLLEAVKRPLGEIDEVLPRMRALALGPGLGRGEEERALVRRLLEETSLPAVVDADALYELEPFERDAPTVLTPHEGELARLLGEESKWVAAHRLEALRRGVERFGCCVLLEGAG